MSTLVPDFVHDGVNLTPDNPFIGQQVQARPESWAWIAWEDCHTVCDTDYNDLLDIVYFHAPENGLMKVSVSETAGLSAYTPYNNGWTPDQYQMHPGAMHSFYVPWGGTEYDLPFFMVNITQSFWLQTGTQNAWVWQSPSAQSPVPEASTSVSLLLGIMMLAVSSWLKRKLTQKGLAKPSSLR